MKSLSRYCEENEFPLAAAKAYCNAIFDWDEDHFADSYVGEYDSERDIDEYLIDTFIECFEVEPAVVPYLDEQFIAREMRYDYFTSEYDGKVYLYRNI